MKNVYLKRKIKSHINNIHRPYSICNWNDRGQWEMLKAFAHTRFITFKLKVNASICCSRVLRLFGFVLYILFIWICFVFFFIIIIMLCFAANALIEVVMVCVYIFWMSFWYCGVVRAAAALAYGNVVDGLFCFYFWSSLNVNTKIFIHIDFDIHMPHIINDSLQ